MVVAAWLAIVAWRPLVLGFYHDDWTLLTVNDPDSFTVREGGRTRPLLSWMHQAGVHFLADSAFAWHVVGALLMLLTSLSVHRFCSAVLRAWLPELNSDWASAAGAIAWMASPWSLGYAAWPVMFPCLLAVLAFCEAGRALCRTDKPIQARLTQSCIFLSISYLIYEAFWFAFIPLLALLVILDRRLTLRATLWAMVLLGGVQLLFVAWNRLLTFYSSGYAKAFNPDWHVTALSSIRRLPYEMMQALGAPKPAFILAGILCGIAFLILALRSREKRKALLIVAAAIAGIVISASLFAVAGYAVTGRGIFSRTTIALNVWLALCVAAFSLLLLAEKRIPSAFAALILIALAVPLAKANVSETLRWAYAWQRQEQVLGRFPIDALPADARNLFILADIPRQADSIETFEAFWDITAALHVRYPKLKGRVQATVARRGEWVSRWDGTAVTQSWCSSKSVSLWTLPATNFSVWDYQGAKMVKPAPPYLTDC